MRVLIYSAAEQADAGGVQGVVHGLAAFLKGNGHTVATAWPDGSGSHDDWALRLTADVDAKGRPSLSGIAKAAADFTRLAAKLARFRPHVVNLHYPRGQTLYFRILQKIFGYKLVITFHGSDYHEASPALIGRLPVWLGRADAVTAVSEPLVEAVEGLTEDTKVRLIENGIDLDFWSGDTGERFDPNLFVAAGRLLPVKGFDLLIDAMAQDRCAPAKLIIAGDGPANAELKKQIETLGMMDRVTLAGRLDADELNDLFHRSGWYVLSSRREGLPLVVLEAMAAGLPVVATAVGGVPKAMGEGSGALVPPSDVHALASAINHRCGNAELREKESLAAKARVSRFAASESYRQYESLFENLL